MSVERIFVGLDSTTSPISTAVGGHYDMPTATASDLAAIQVAQVTYLPESSFGPAQSAADLTNTISLTGQGGRPMKIVVRCQRQDGSQLEVEFGIRFGL